MIEAGKYTVKISDYGVKETQAKNPFIEVWFAVEGKGDVRWAGYLTEKTVERTLKTLAILGLKGPLETIADGPIGKALDMNVEVEIEVELKPWTTDATKKSPQVKWVNAIRGAKFDAAVTASVKNKLSKFAGNWAKVKGDMGVKPKTEVGF
jgi:hypothetical protein